MKLLLVSTNEAGQRLDKLLVKYLNEAPKSFIYKMLRKKNITLNGKKASGSELLVLGDEVRLFFSDETFDKFHTSTYQKASRKLDILYEDDHILLINKPAGMLSQRADGPEQSLVEYLITYLIESKAMTQEQLASFHPSVCNRLDRNTSGIVVAGKSLTGLQEMSRLLGERTMHKYYRCIVSGRMTGNCRLNGYLKKNHGTNQVQILKAPEDGALPIETEYRVLAYGEGVTLLEVLLITGRSHQIRAHLASIGHPIIGDPKYGKQGTNERYSRAYHIRYQLLHAYRLEFPDIEGTLSYLSGKSFTAPVPEIYQKLVPYEG
ncbi:MAG: RluA family pseudouridine synthase [Lachnospiraceae bacterium]|nr:RluA family pseudouridine synthase [Lachnospiraceae bacterium]